MANSKSPPPAGALVDLKTKLTRLVNLVERAHDASGPLLGLCNLHEKLLETKNDEDHGDVLNWYKGYYEGSIQEAMKNLAQVIDATLDDVESTVRPMLAEVSNGNA